VSPPEREKTMKFQKFSKNGFQLTTIQSTERILFIPALFFILLGLLAIVAPRFVLFLVASFFVFIGCLAAFIAWKFIQLRKKFNTVVKDLSGKVVVQAARHQSPFDFEDDIIIEESKKKITYH
jgi:hypothetical protein